MQENSAPNRGLGLIAIFSNHPVAANLLMVMMLLAGLWGLRQLNTQFFPTFEIDYATVRVVWSGASAEDVEDLITTPLEQALRDVDFVKEMTSTSAEGVSAITLEFEEKTDMGLAVDQVKERVDQVRNLPEDAETPEVSKVTRYEGVTNLLVVGTDDVSELRGLVNRFETDLLDRGIANIRINGLPEEQIAVEIPSSELRKLDLSLDEIGRRVSAWSRDVPIGIIGRGETSRQLRFNERRESAIEFESIPILTDQQGQLVTLGDIATITKKPRENQSTISYQGRPAVELQLNRTDNSDSLEAASIFREWIEDTRPQLPVGIQIVPFNERWELLEGRINLLVKNGLGGLLLVVVILFLFMNGRVAWWTAVGIPVSFMATLALLYLAGGSINMISLFALIMALGIIVDDAIVVGEQAMTNYERGERPRLASQNAAQQMLGPVFSSSLTTIAAFMPLLIVGGIMGAIMEAIPVVIICVIIASLIECFLILPGHLTHSFRKMGAYRPGRLRKCLDNGFERFRDGVFRPIVTACVNQRLLTLSTMLAILIVTVGWVQSGRISFQFFPTAESDRLYANISFVSGTPESTVKRYLKTAEQTLYEIEDSLEGDFIKLVISRHGALEGRNSGGSGDHVGAIRVELVDPDQRTIRNREIIQAWREALPRVPGIENLSILEPRAGPPGSDIDLRISGQDISQVKQASEEIQNALLAIPGVSGISDDTPYGREQLVLKLKPVAEALGLTVQGVSSQLRAAFDGFQVQELSDGIDDVEVNISLPQQERDSLASLYNLDIVLPGGGTELLQNLARVTSERGFENLRHSNGRLAVTVIGSVDPAVNNTNDIRANLESELLPRLASELGVSFSFEGRQSDQSETLGDMKLGAALAFTMIYLVLSWVFGSYGWPLIVMVIIPFGLIGAIWGHVVMDQNITLLSLFGFFGLSGIVVNDSIILMVFYRQLREKGVPFNEAIIEAACARLRAVLLTSMTTVAGLTPLLFETSLQAQFLIPMAISIAFGLGFATVLVLLVIPSLLYVYESTFIRLGLQGAVKQLDGGDTEQAV